MTASEDDRVSVPHAPPTGAAASTARPSPPARPGVGYMGPDHVLQYLINDPSEAGARVGVILWGFGIAEVKTARRLAHLGIPCMQIRFTKSHREHSPQEINRHNFGAEACRIAMDLFSAERGVRAFVLMGNCALANICLSAAIAEPQDPRVAGLVLTNPHLLREDAAGALLRHKILKASTWARLFSGRVDVKGAMRFAASATRATLRPGAKKIPSKAPPGAPRPSYDTVISAQRYRAALAELSARGLKMLITGGARDRVFVNFSITCRRALRQAIETGNVTLHALDTDFHIFSRDDTASTLLADSVSQWMHATRFRVPDVAAEAS